MAEVLTTQPAPTIFTKGFFNAWKQAPCKCIHCGKILPSVNSKNSHLQFCKSRILKRYFKINSLLFIIEMNPLKRKSSSLHKLILDYGDEKLFLGGLIGFENYHLIKKYTVVDLKEYPKLLSLKNGQTKGGDILRLMKEVSK